MPTTTTTYSFNKPVVGADEDDWGGYLNGNWDSVDDLLDGTTPVTGIDINSGTLDGVTIGGTTAGAGTFTTLTATTSITGTLATAAQPNITSVGSLTSLDVGGTVTADGLTVETGVTTQATAIELNGTSFADTERLSLDFSRGGSQGVRLSLEPDEAQTNGDFAIETGSFGSTSDRLRIEANGDISFYEDTGTTAKFFWDASAESLGLGATSFAGETLRMERSGDMILGLFSGAANGTYLNMGTTANRDIGQISYTQSTNHMSFRTNDAERMRIDSSGNLLVNSTSISVTSSGSHFGAYGSSANSSFVAQSDGAVTGYINRNTSDGELLRFSKSGSTVGSIGVASSAIHLGNQDTGIRFAGGADAIQPWNTGTNSARDGAIDLGTSSARFKDLYLSGGIEIENGTGNVGVGKQALNSNTASANTAVGYQSLYDNTTGGSLVAVGHTALANNTTASNNVAVGVSSLTLNTTGAENVALGTAALSSNTVGNNLVAVGRQALASATIGSNNVAVGRRALYSTTTASNLVAVGEQALTANTTGQYNTAIGRLSLFSNTTASNNTAVGYQALYANTTGFSNLALGRGALKLNTTASLNTVVGDEAMRQNTTGGSNVAVGTGSMLSNTTGTTNTAVGRNSLFSNTTASNNTAVGYEAGYSNTTGHSSVYVGWQSGRSNTTAIQNTYVGQYAGYSTTGNNNTFIGGGAGYLVSTGTKNTVLGSYSGNQGGLDIRTSSNNIVLSDGDGNPRGIFDSIGRFLVGKTATGYQNANGFSLENLSLGAYMITGHANGTSSGREYQIFTYNTTPIGSITQSGTTGVAYNTSSDHRLKENVVDLTGATERLKQLEPKRFNFIADADTTVDGFLAHEVQTVVPEAITGTHNEVDADGNPVYQGIDQSKLVPLLVATIKELEARITALENP
jgi:hypothetical protein